MKEFVVYSIDNCPYCDAAKALLNNKKFKFTEFNITHDDNQKRALIQKTGHRTMPQIFFGDEFIGGYNELKFYLNK